MPASSSVIVMVKRAGMTVKPEGVVTACRMTV